MMLRRVPVLLTASLFSILISLAPVKAVTYSDAEKAKMEELWATATLWEVGENREIVPKAREELIKFGEKAVEFILVEKMDTIDSLQTRAIDVVIQALPEISKPMMMKALETETRQNAGANLIRLLATLKATQSAPAIMQILQSGKLPSGVELNPRLRRTALDALGTLDFEPGLPIVAESLRSGDERERLISAQSLSRFSSLEKIPYLTFALGDERFTVRMSAVDGILAAFRKQPEEVWKKLWQEFPPGWVDAESYYGSAMNIRNTGEIHYILGEFGNILAERLKSFKPDVPIEADSARKILDEIINDLNLVVNHSRWEQRFHAVQALAKIKDKKALDILRKVARVEKNPLVLQVVKEALGMNRT